MSPSADKPATTDQAASAEQRAGQASPPPELDPAYFVSERYEFLRVIGDGLMGVVFEMLDRETQEVVAARLISHAVPREPKKFARALDSLSRIEHPHLVRFLEHVEHDGMHYVVSQFAEGVDLLTYLRQPPSAEELAALRQREDIVDAGITDTHEAAHTGPIEVAVDYDASQDAPEDEEAQNAQPDSKELVDLGRITASGRVIGAGSPAETGTYSPARAPQAGDPAKASAEPPSDPSLELGDLLSEELTLSESGEVLAEEVGDAESAAAIVESVADPVSMGHQEMLDLVLLRLERTLPQIVDALEYLHRFKKHHGDLKPGNILVDHTGRCLLTDYGLVQRLAIRRGPNEQAEDAAARAAGAEADTPADTRDADADKLQDAALRPDDPDATQVNFGPPTERALAESFAYRAPENLDFEETQQAGPTADLYALGCVLFEAVSTRRPFQGSAAEIREQQLHADPPALSEIEPYCPASWADVIHGLLAKNPERRASLREVRELVAYSESYAIDIPASAIPEQDLFFGRSEVIDLILDRIKACYQQKRLGVSILRGDSGVGKTAITQAISYLVSRRGWLVLSGKCYDRESLIYQGWDEIAAQLARIFEDLPADVHQKIDLCRRQAATLFPVLRLADDPPVGRMARLDAIDSFRSLLRRIASQRPILLLVDDLHWASWDTSALLLDVLGEPKGLRCMVLGTWLGDPADTGARKARHPLLDGLGSAPLPVEWIDLGGFSKDEAREYVISAGAHLSLPDQQRVLKGGASNPLLLEELIYETRKKAPGERGELLSADAPAGARNPAPELTPGGAASKLSGPDEPAPPRAKHAGTPAPGGRTDEKLTTVVAERLETLSRRDRFVLELLSTASIPLPISIISTILSDEFGKGAPGENNARDALDRLLASRFIEPVKSHHWDVAYTVAHNSYRALILEQLRDQRYAHLCKGIAEGIRRCWPSAEELRFEYLLRAGLDREAADSAIRAASSAEQRYAYNRAAKLWRWLSKNAGFTSVDPDTNPVAEHARLERLAHRYTQAHELFNQVAQAAKPGPKRARFLRDEFDACMRAAHHGRALVALNEALQNLGENYQPRGVLWRVEALKDRMRAGMSRGANQLKQAEVDAAGREDRLRAGIYSMVLDVEDLLDPAHVDRIHTRLALLADRTGDARLLGLDRLYLAHHAALSGGGGRSQRIADWLAQAAQLFARTDDPQLRGLCELFLVDHLRRHGDFEQAEAHLAQAAKYFHNTRLSELRQRYRLRLTYARLLGARGALHEANLVARQVLHFWRGDRYVIFRAYQVLLPNALTAGHTQYAEQLLVQCRPLLADLPTSLADVWLGRMDAQLNIALGRAEVAVGHLDVLAEKMHACGLIKNPLAAALLYLSHGQALAALAERERSLIHHRRTDTLERLRVAQGAVHARRRALAPGLRAEAARLRSRLEMLRGNAKKGLRVLDQAIEELADYPNPIEWAKCLEARARLLRTLDASEAPALLEQAIAAYTQFGAHLPLYLEGWPVPHQFSKLGRDEA